MVEVRKLFRRESCCKFVNNPTEEGIGPVRLFTLKYNKFNFDNFPISVGIFPVKEF